MWFQKLDGKDLESFDYDRFESVVNENGTKGNFKNGRETRYLVVLRWAITLIIGITTSSIGIFIFMLSHTVFDWKLHWLYHWMKNGNEYAFVYFVAVNLATVSIAGFCTVYQEPVAAGSGITEIKAILNGVKLPRVLRLRTLMCKVLGTISSVASGLPVGKEGPMIHSGGIVGAGLSQGKSSTLGYDTSFTFFAGFRNDHEKRDFVLVGAAAGVAAAFGAPIGGVLFVLEEGASFWKQELTWRTSFCAMISTFSFAFTVSVLHRDGGTLGSQAGTFSFGPFESSTYEAWEVLLFTLMGVGGGVFGGLFNYGNTKLTRIRSRWVTTRLRSFLEVCIVSIFVSCVCFGLPYYFGTCLPRPSIVYTSGTSTPQQYPYRKDMITFYCANDDDHNDLATLFISSGEIAIKQLFHAPANTFDPWNLILFWIALAFMACITYGIKIPSGLFVPSLLIGAAYGRLCTKLVNYVTQSRNLKVVDPRSYGLIGSAAMLGGITRMTISLTVIILECTGNIQYGLPLITTLFAARWIGNCFNEGIYDIHLHLKHLPFLDWQPPLVGSFLRTKHVMARNPKCLPPIAKAGDVLDLLLDTKHNGIPIVQDHPTAGNNFLVGIILRKQLSVILHHRDYYAVKPIAWSRFPPTHPPFSPNGTQKCLSHYHMEGQYPRYASYHGHQLKLSSSERKCWVDLTPYLNATPHVIQEKAPFTRAYSLFRNEGLRHLIVVNPFNCVTGIITRRDLQSDHCARCYHLALISHEITEEHNLAERKSWITKLLAKSRRNNHLSAPFLSNC